MTDNLAFTLICLLAALLVAGGFLRSALLARSHRDVGGFIGGIVTASLILGVGLSLVFLPDMWLWIYDHTIGLSDDRE